MSWMGEALGDVRLAKLFTGAMILVGIYVVVRHGAELAYALGKFVGAQ